MKQTNKAFQWITGLLEKHRVPYQISGGLAAKIYGSKRELADIDIDMPNDKITELLPLIKNYVVAGPCVYKDNEWNLFGLNLNYKGQDIDLCGSDNQQIFDKTKKKWVGLKVDFSKSIEKEVFGMKIPVIPRKLLIAYKSKIRREVDLEDIKAIK